MVEFPGDRANSRSRDIEYSGLLNYARRKFRKSELILVAAFGQGFCKKLAILKQNGALVAQEQAFVFAIHNVDNIGNAFSQN